MQVDFFNPAIQLNYSGVDDSNKPLVKKQAMAYQRMQQIGKTTKTNQQLLAKGYSSAWDIIEEGERNFVSTAGLPLNEAKDVYTTALNTVTATSNFVQAIRDTQHGGFTALAVNNMGQMVNDLRQIDGYSALFGNQDYCECEHCKSIFSPAAYFTALMLFVDKNVTQRYFTGPRATSSIKLENRRSDLWTVPLSCQNTSTEIPYLDIVIEVLEKNINEDSAEVYKMLAEYEISSGLPFNLPLYELRTYLGHFGYSLSQVYTMLNEASYKQQQERLLLSDKELYIIGTPKPAQAFTIFGNPPNLSEFAVSDFIRFAGISRTDLDELVEMTSIAALGDMGTRVVESTEDIQQYKELFTTGSITAGNLDMVNRFVRLWKKTPWRISEFDRILIALSHVGLFSTFEENDAEGHFKILVLADVIRIQSVLKLTVEELCAVIDVLPEPGLNPNEKGLYARLFNLKEIFTTDIDNAILTNNRADDKITPHLLAGLSINEQELNMLFQQLGINNIDAPVTLNRSLISRLYRQSRLATGLKLSIEAFVAAVKVCIGNEEVRTVQQMVKLIDYKRWIDASPFTPQQLDFVLNDTESIEYSYNLEKAEALITELKDAVVLPNIAFSLETLKNKIQSIFGINRAELTANSAFLTVDITDTLITALNAETVDDDDLNAFLNFLNQLERKVLYFDRLKKIFYFDKLKWKDDNISFLKENAPVFGVADLTNWSMENVKAMVSYSKLFTSLPAETKTDIREVLQGTAAVNNLNDTAVDLLSRLWAYPATLLHSVINTIPITGALASGIERLHQLSTVCNTLGIQADSLIKLKETSYEGLIAAKDVVYGSFASKYADEKTRLEKLEAYHDKINTLKRDALCAYIISQRSFNFKDRSDLYNFFLLDVEMSGCFRTSRLLAAISSVQLYIHRCRMNLEKSADNTVVITADAIDAAQWKWMQNYRVWEANTKVFLYPENYIQPDLNPNKTPLFKELEDELLQQNITMDTAEAAYKKYLAQFLELSHLRYAGAYYNHVETQPVNEVTYSATESGTGMVVARLMEGQAIDFSESYIDKDKTIYYFFARTHLQPYQYYYRTFNQYKNLWRHWQKIDLPIEAGEISSIIHNGKLYVYWTEVQHKEVTTISGGSSSSEGVIFKVTSKYSVLDANNKWSSPQRLYLGKVPIIDNKLFELIGVANITEIDKKANQDNKNSIIDKFKLEVFKKPYVVRTDVAGKLHIKHIFTPTKYNDKVTYRTEPFRDFATFDIEVSNGEFPTTINRRVGNSQITVTVTSPTNAILSLKYWFLSYWVPVYLDGIGIHALPTPGLPISTTNYVQYVYRYIENPNRAFDKEINPIEYDDFFYKEFAASFAGGSNYSHFIEDGTIDFVTGNRNLNQSRDGLTHLTIGPSIDQSVIVLSTTLSEVLNVTLWKKGLEVFLSPETQKMPDSAGQHFDFKGPYGAYYWELFFHIPFLIADHLNANQDFEGAKWWYERIFNPTSDEKPLPTKPGEHYWQFREFRNLDITRLKDILVDEATIAIYKEDPFDPHAIADLRPSAYQKAIVMKYIDNLLDWGDFLFTQDTQESIVEADMLYQLAQDILGKCPERTGKCKTENDEELTFEQIISSGEDNSEFFINLENVRNAVQSINTNDKAVLQRSKYLSKLLEELGDEEATPTDFKEWAALSNAVYYSDLSNTAGNTMPVQAPLTSTAKTEVFKYSDVAKMGYTPATTQPKIHVDINTPGIELEYGYGTDRLPATDLASAGNLAFCVPVNENILAYWDRVEDRLFKIRNCMNISGIRRSLALYQPPIDPMLLVMAKAAGLSLEEISAIGTGAIPLPNYRFVYMLEKAKQFAQTVQGFGGALLSALEKKDAEELTLLRSVHERNILRLTKDIKSKQVQEARKQYISLEESITNIENRIEYYQGLIDEGLTGWENTQMVTKHLATFTQSASTLFYGQSSIFALLPQLGSPFSINWGGKQVSTHWDNWGKFLSSNASVLESISSSAGLEAVFQRRKEDWHFQLDTVNQEMKQATQQLLAADLRIKIAERDQEIHEKTIEQSDEVHEFLQDKFTGLGLYNYMATSLNRLYRLSYTMALDMAKQAEQCYKTETFDKAAVFIENDNWQNDMAGLLSGEKLLLQLQRMEKTFMDRNTRQQEITQSFSLAQINPAALLKLRQTGSFGTETLPPNDVWIPEIVFDLLYPGQYQRVIKSVRISIPCIAGPYTNISAKLTLKDSRIRKSDKLNTDPLTTEEEDTTPVAKNTSITTSSSQNDGGVFELNFRDERYLPFEGAGAISRWQLELPGVMRSFNYDTISDVIFHISYTAKDDAAFRTRVEENLRDRFMDLAGEGLPLLLSLKHEFPDEWHQFKNTLSDNAEFTLSVSKDMLPFFAANRSVAVKGLTLYAKKIEKSDKNEIPFNSNQKMIFDEGLPHSINLFKASISDLPPGTIDENDFSYSIGMATIEVAKLENLFFVINYTLA